MAIVDWIIIGVLAISMLISFRRGFVKEALSLVTWFAAVIVARVFGSELAVLLEPHIATSSIRFASAYAMLFIGTLIAGGMVNFMVGEFIKMTGLTGTDRFLGMFFGLARGGILVMIAVAILHYAAPVEQDGWYQQSVLIPEIVRVIEELGPVLWDQGGQLLNKQTPATSS
ncbi:MAG: CvpA family protein [Proteobacteria bacterium]|nr:CvpA family protein [Pseudomonadota bacterium]